MWTVLSLLGIILASPAGQLGSHPTQIGIIKESHLVTAFEVYVASTQPQPDRIFSIKALLLFRSPVLPYIGTHRQFILWRLVDYAIGPKLCDFGCAQSA